MNMASDFFTLFEYIISFVSVPFDIVSSDSRYLYIVAPVIAFILLSFVILAYRLIQRVISNV